MGTFVSKKGENRRIPAEKEMSIVKIRNQSGILYAYESTSVWDPSKQQARPIRKYLGRVDEETGEIIPTKGRGRKKKSSNTESHDDQAQKENLEKIKELQISNQKLKNKVDELEEKIRSMKQEKKELLAAIKKLAKDYE